MSDKWWALIWIFREIHFWYKDIQLSLGIILYLDESGRGKKQLNLLTTPLLLSNHRYVLSCFILKDMNFVYFGGKYEYESTQSTRSFLFLSNLQELFRSVLPPHLKGFFFSGKKSPSYNESIRCDTIHNATIVVTGIVTCQKGVFGCQTSRVFRPRFNQERFFGDPLIL